MSRVTANKREQEFKLKCTYPGHLNYHTATGHTPLLWRWWSSLCKHAVWDFSHSRNIHSVLKSRLLGNTVNTLNITYSKTYKDGECSNVAGQPGPGGGGAGGGGPVWAGGPGAAPLPAAPHQPRPGHRQLAPPPPARPPPAGGGALCRQLPPPPPQLPPRPAAEAAAAGAAGPRGRHPHRRGGHAVHARGGGGARHV